MLSPDPSKFLNFLSSNFRLFLTNGAVVHYPEYARRWIEEKTSGCSYQTVLDFKIQRIAKLDDDLFEVTMETTGLVQFDSTVYRVESVCFDTWVETFRGWCIETRIKVKDLYQPTNALFSRSSCSLPQTDALAPAMSETMDDSTPLPAFAALSV